MYFDGQYVKGDILPEYAGAGSDCRFILTEKGAQLLLLREEPSVRDVFCVENQALELRLSCFPNALWFTVQIGNLPWEGTPFSPHLSDTNLMENLWPACETLTVVLIDVRNGEVKGVRTMPFDDAFSAALRVGTMCLLSQDFEQEGYDYLVSMLKDRIAPEQIADNAVAGFSSGH